MLLTVNGEVAQAPPQVTLAAFVVSKGLNPNKIAVERNFEIVPRSLYGETILAAGDRIEIVQFVGGG
jgi:sulfur carrier protein